MDAKIKFEVELDLKTVKALAQLGVVGMEEQVLGYRRAVRRWANNMDRILGFAQYLSEVPPSLKNEGFKGCLEQILVDADALMSPDQNRYVWSAIDASAGDLFVEIVNRSASMLSSGSVSIAEKEFICDMQMDIRTIIDKFREVHGRE